MTEIATKPGDPLAFTFGLEFKTASERSVGERDERHKHATRLLPYHVGFFDDYMRGITPHDLVLFGADSGVGKTDAVTEIAERTAADGRNVYMFALEAEPREIERRVKYRWIARTAIKRDHAIVRDLNYPDWYLGRLSSRLGPLEQEADEYMARLTGLHTYYKGRDFTGADIHRLCLAVQNRADLIIIDHLQKISHALRKKQAGSYACLAHLTQHPNLSQPTSPASKQKSERNGQAILTADLLINRLKSLKDLHLTNTSLLKNERVGECWETLRSTLLQAHPRRHKHTS